VFTLRETGNCGVLGGLVEARYWQHRMEVWGVDKMGEEVGEMTKGRKKRPKSLQLNPYFLSLQFRGPNQGGRRKLRRKVYQGGQEAPWDKAKEINGKK